MAERTRTFLDKLVTNPREISAVTKPALRVAVKMKPERRRLPGRWHLLMHRLAALGGIGAGTPSAACAGADLEAVVLRNDPDLKRALLDALEADEDVDSYQIEECSEGGP